MVYVHFVRILVVIQTASSLVRKKLLLEIIVFWGVMLM